MNGDLLTIETIHFWGTRAFFVAVPVLVQVISSCTRTYVVFLENTGNFKEYVYYVRRVPNTAVGTVPESPYAAVVLSFILDVRLVDVTQEERYPGFLRLPSAVLAFILIARWAQPSLSLVDREVEFCVKRVQNQQF